MKRRPGFTLIELVIVMMIISGIFAYAIPAIRSYQRAAIKAGIDGDLRLISAALRIYSLEHAVFPAEKDYQQTLIDSSPPILDKVLPDPYSDLGNIPYTYALSPNKLFYVVYSVGSMGSTKLTVLDNGKVKFITGLPAVEKWASNGHL